MKDTTEKEAPTSQGSQEAHAHTSAAPLLKKNRTFGWLQAAIIAIPLVLVGVFIVLNTFAATLSPHTKAVQDIYWSLLHRRPAADDNGVQYWAKKLDAGTSQAAVESAIKNTAEYKSKHSTTPPAQDGKKTTTNNPQLTDAQADAAVRAIYKKYHQKPDTTGLAYWKKQLTSGAQNVGGIDAFFASKAKQAKASNPANRTSVSNCEATLLKGYILTGPNRNFFGGDGSAVGAKAAALRDSAENIVRAADRKYLGLRHPYGEGGSAYGGAGFGWELTNQEVKDIDDLSTCKVSVPAYISNLANSAVSKAWIAKLDNINKTIVNPIRAAYNALPHELWGKVIYPDTWIAWVLQGKMSTDEAIAHINEHVAGVCPDSGDGDPVFASCSGGGGYVSQDDLSAAQDKVAAATAAAQANRNSGSKPSSTTSSGSSTTASPYSPPAGTNNVDR